MERQIYSWKKNIYEKELYRLNEHPDHNKELILEFHRSLFSKQCGEVRVAKLSSQLRMVSKWIQKRLDTLSKEDVENLLVTINTHKNWSNETKKDYRRLLKQYISFKFGKNSSLLENIIVAYNEKSKITHDLISENDILTIMKIIRSEKDKAFIFMLYETGARIGEFLNIKIRDIVKEENMTKVRLYGKTGERRVVIHGCIPYLFDYLKKHSDRDNPSAFLWVGESHRYKNKPLVYTGAVRLIRRCFLNAGLPHKQCNPHNFRHSRATSLAKSLTEVQLCLLFGWKIGSKVVSTYVHASGRDLDEAMCKHYGIKTKEESQPKLVPQRCKICKYENGCADSFCGQCGTPLNVKIAIDSQDKVKHATEEGIEILLKIAQDKELMRLFQQFMKTNVNVKES